MMGFMARSGTDVSIVYQLKITLTGIRPPIWRRVLVPGRIRLCALHDVFQTAMGWSNSHLHLFEKGKREWSVPEWDEFGELNLLDEKDTRLDELLLKPRDSLSYVYDWGDDWRHRVILEKIGPVLTAPIQPSCIAGKRKCPPEDVGGVGGYQEFLDAIFDPAHEDHSRFLTWAGGYFQAEEFDVKAVNAVLAGSRWPEMYLR